MKKITVFLILFSVLFSACSPEPVPNTEERLCFSETVNEILIEVCPSTGVFRMISEGEVIFNVTATSPTYVISSGQGYVLVDLIPGFYLVEIDSEPRSIWFETVSPIVELSWEQDSSLQITFGNQDTLEIDPTNFWLR